MTSISTDEAGAVRTARILGSLLILALFVCAPGRPGFLAGGRGQEQTAPASVETSLLKFLGIEASAESIDYVQNKTQFQLHDLLTEQRHPKTWNLSERVGKDAAAGLRMIVSVDQDIVDKLDSLAADPAGLEEMARAVEGALLQGRSVYIYGCGATGRLAKQMESGLWRPFWRKAAAEAKVGAKLGARFGGDAEGRLIGEMTGGDRALISSLEGFEIFNSSAGSSSGTEGSKKAMSSSASRRAGRPRRSSGPSWPRAETGRRREPSTPAKAGSACTSSTTTPTISSSPSSGAGKSSRTRASPRST